jgi:type IV pilus assembly protein PilY1
MKLSTSRPLQHAMLALMLLASLSVFAATDISSVPLAVKNNVAPNLMFMIDSSGSVSNIVPESPFVETTTYLASCPTANKAPGGFVDPKDTSVATTYDIFIRSTGVTKFGTGGYGSTTNYTFGNSGAATTYRCFDPALYYNFRLNADTFNTDCDTFANGADCKYPGTGYLDAVYKGNYLNWYFGLSTASPAYSTAATLNYTTGRKTGTQSRLEIAKLAAKTTIAGLPLPSGGANAKVRVGLSSYNSGDGGALKLGLINLANSTSVTNFNSAVDTVVSSGNTPLAETLADIGHYFTIPYTGNLTIPKTPAVSVSVANLFRQSSTTPHRLSGTLPTCSRSLLSGSTTVYESPNCPTQYWCQRNYAILLTDGRPQGDQALSTNTYLSDYDGDCPTGASACTGSYDLKKTGAAGTVHAGHLGSTHTYESAGSDYLDDVAQALFEIDLRPDLPPPAGRTKKSNIRTYTIGFADYQVLDEPLLTEAAAQGGGLYLTATDTATLVTKLKTAVEDALAKDGASAAVAVVNTQITIDNTAYASKYNSGYWIGDLEAFGLDTTTGLPISPSYWSAQAKLEAVSNPETTRKIVTWNGTAGAAFNTTSSGLAANLVAYIRGNKSLEGTTYRTRNKLLADIVNAEPVVVKYGATPVVFQGANDGMLHVFDGSKTGTTAGQELWAYIPKLVHGNLASFADPNYAHAFFVDATPAVADVGTTKYLVGGLGAGGKGYYALDITNYAAATETDAVAKVKWEFSNASLGNTYGTPLIVNTSSGWRVVVPSGYNNDSTGKVFLLDPADGSLEATIDTGASGDVGLAHLAKSSALGATDIVRYVYGGDLQGNVWRFDLNSLTAKKIAILTDAVGATQPVSVAPAVGAVSGSLTKNFIYVGTGLYLGDSDIATNTPHNSFSTQTQSFYGIIDDTTVATPTLPDTRGTNGSTCPSGGGDGDFVCQSAPAATTTTASTFSSNALSSKRGWYWDIPVINGTLGRVVTAPQLTTGGTVAMTINMPTNVTCDPGGSSAFVAVDALNGGAILTSAGSGTYHSTMTFLGFALASRPVIIVTSSGKRGVIRLSDQTYASPPVYEPPVPPNTTPASWKRVYWRELK